jgi:hypothetical protein
MTWAKTTQDTINVLNTTVLSEINAVRYKCDEVLNKKGL